MGSVQVDGLVVLDLRNPTVQAQLQVTYLDLVSDELTICQEIARQARAQGLDGLIAPSAALIGDTTLVVFEHALDRVQIEGSRVQHAPASILDIRHLMRLPRAERRAIARIYRRLRRLVWKV